MKNMFPKQPRFVEVKPCPERYFSPEAPSSAAQEALQRCLGGQSFLARARQRATNRWVKFYKTLMPSVLEVTKEREVWPKPTGKSPLASNGLVWCSSESGQRLLACHTAPAGSSLGECWLGLIYLLGGPEYSHGGALPWPPATCVSLSQQRRRSES